MDDVISRLNSALGGRYTVKEEIGQGGMAVVYLAEDLKHHRKVALKVLRPELAAIIGSERFLKEIEVAANLQHPNILPLYDSGDADPVRVVVREAEYEALLFVSETMDWRFRVALILAHETGHRIGAIRSLRWSDVDLEDDLIRWRAENEKTGFEHHTPMTVGAREALEYARDNNPGIGETPIFPAPRNPSQAMSRHLARNWWRRAERLAGLEPKAGRGWHSLRRKFASDLMHKPLKVLSQLGGWKNPQTILICYQHPDQQQMREALEDRRKAANEV